MRSYADSLIDGSFLVDRCVLNLRMTVDGHHSRVAAGDLKSQLLVYFGSAGRLRIEVSMQNHLFVRRAFAERVKDFNTLKAMSSDQARVARDYLLLRTHYIIRALRGRFSRSMSSWAANVIRSLLPPALASRRIKAGSMFPKFSRAILMFLVFFVPLISTASFKSETCKDAFTGSDAAPDFSARSPFRILGLNEGASDSEIRKAFRRLAVIYHPDKAGATSLATQQFAILSDARDRAVKLAALSKGKSSKRKAPDTGATNAAENRDDKSSRTSDPIGSLLLEILNEFLRHRDLMNAIEHLSSLQTTLFKTAGLSRTVFLVTMVDSLSQRDAVVAFPSSISILRHLQHSNTLGVADVVPMKLAIENELLQVALAVDQARPGGQSYYHYLSKILERASRSKLVLVAFEDATRTRIHSIVHDHVGLRRLQRESRGRLTIEILTPLTLKEEL